MPRRPPPSAYAVPREGATQRRSSTNPFGTPRLRDWRIPEGGSQDGLGAARMQHELARELRLALVASDEGSIAEFARQHSELTYERLRAILAGDAWMRLEDLSTLCRILGLEPRFTFQALSDE